MWTSSSFCIAFKRRASLVNFCCIFSGMSSPVFCSSISSLWSYLIYTSIYAYVLHGIRISKRFTGLGWSDASSSSLRSCSEATNVASLSVLLSSSLCSSTHSKKKFVLQPPYPWPRAMCLKTFDTVMSLYLTQLPLSKGFSGSLAILSFI